ncbi:hypothetical protein GF337_11795 [candidate division KSB1 bacterium]|nr:hypothetical protein [candidate division KSB1 bacterium]
MKISEFTLDSLNWSQFDEDRWIASSIITVIVCIITFFGLRSIQIPETPEKVIPPEIIEFVPEVKKVEPKKVVNEQQQEIEEKEVEENIDDIIEEFRSELNMMPEFVEIQTISDHLNKFEKENPDRSEAAAQMLVTQGYNFEQSEADPLDMIQGLQSVDEDESIRSMQVTDDPRRKKGITSDEGLSTRPPSSDNVISSDFAGFSGNIKWEDWMDPLLDWIKNNQSPIYEVAEMQMNVQSSDHTARQIINVQGVRYELLLASKPEKRQLTFCLIDLSDGSYMMLIDQGFKKSSNYFNIGNVERMKGAMEIVDFTGRTKPASDPKAKKFTKIFWSWANSIIEKG